MKWIGTGSATNIISNDALLKSHIYVGADDTTYDNLLVAYIKSAGAELESKVDYPLTFPGIIIYGEAKNNRLKLPKNTSTLTKLEYLDGDTWVEQTDINLTTVTRNDYKIYSEIVSELLKCNVEYKVTAAATVNADEVIKQAARMMVAEKFEKRENGEVKTYNRDIDFLLCNVTSY